MSADGKSLRKISYNFNTVICVVFALVALFFVWFSNSEFMKIDKCLDSGGAWNDTLKTCESS